MTCTHLRFSDRYQLRALFEAGPRGVADGDTLSGKTIKKLRALRLAERREDGLNIITEGGIAALFGAAG